MRHVRERTYNYGGFALKRPYTIDPDNPPGRPPLPETEKQRCIMVSLPLSLIIAIDRRVHAGDAQSRSAYLRQLAEKELQANG